MANFDLGLDPKLLTADEVERIKTRAEAVPDYFGITGSPAAQRNAYEVGQKDVPRLIADLERARALLKNILGYHDPRQACVHMEGPQLCQEAHDYLREAGIEPAEGDMTGPRPASGGRLLDAKFGIR